MTMTARTALFLSLALLISAAAYAQESGATVWEGEMITFSKADGADPSLEANQDRITEDVWITRDNNGGEIYNAAIESSETQGVSPRGTRWALGTTEDLGELEFGSFRDTIRPKDVVGEPLVLHLVESDIYLDLEFTEWSRQKRGGFAYRRATPSQ